MSDTFHIHNIMPCTISMQAVFYDFDEEEVYRRDVLCLAVVHYYEEQEPPTRPFGSDATWQITPTPLPESYIRPMVGDEDGYIDDPDFIDGFLGVEYGGIIKNWDSKIREVVEEYEKKSFKKELN